MRLVEASKPGEDWIARLGESRESVTAACAPGSMALCFPSLSFCIAWIASSYAGTVRSQKLASDPEMARQEWNGMLIPAGLL